MRKLFLLLPLLAVALHAQVYPPIAAASASGGVTSFNTRTGPVAPQSADYSSFYLPLTGGTLSGAIIAPGFTVPSDGVHPTYQTFLGNTTVPAVTPNTAGFLGPNIASFTAYDLQLPSAGPSSAAVLCAGALASAVSSLSFCSSSITVQHQTCTLGSSCTLPAPQVTVYATNNASGTYTTPANAAYLVIEMVGAGGGGSGSGGTPTAGGAGSASTFGASLLSAGGGGGAPIATSANGGSAGAATGGDINIPGAQAPTSPTTYTYFPGVGGAASFYGGGGAGGGSGCTGGNSAAVAGGGGGGGGDSGTAGPGGGGGSGAYLKKTITSPAATYAYQVGGQGSAGAAGSAGCAGGYGGPGLITITAYFQ